MKVLFIGDPHLRINRFQLAKELLDWIVEMVKIHKPDLVVNLGDTFHDHAVLRSELLEEFRRHIITITSDLNTEYVYVLGNHDQYKPKDATYHALQNFTRIPKLIIIDKPQDIYDMTFVPYLPDHDVFPKQTKPICVAHQTFIGADYGFMREDVGVNADAVSAEVIISGHIHKKQEFGKVTYPGVPYAQNANDVDQHKAILLFDTNTFSKQWIDSPFPVWRSVELTLDQESDAKALAAKLVTKLNDRDHFLLNVYGPRAEINGFLKSKDYSAAVKGKSILPRPFPTDKEKQQVTIVANSPDQVLSSFVQSVYNGSIEKDRLLKKLNDIYGKVNGLSN